MEMFCPECMGPLSSSDGRTAVCRTHGGTYQILFARFPVPGMPGADVPGEMGIAGAPALDARCLTHPDSPAIVFCHNCRAPVCATCDFAFPGDIHLCPNCAANSRPQMSSGRRKLIPWSIGLAGVGIVGLVGMFVAFTLVRNKAASAEAIGIVFELVSFWPAVIGLALGIASFDKRLKTPGTVWIGIVGSGLVVVIWILLILVGRARH